MAENPNWAAARTGAAAAEVDQGLRSYMLGVYNYMAIALAITGAVAFGVSRFLIDASGAPTALFVSLYQSPLRWLIMLAPLAPVLFLRGRLGQLSITAAQSTFWIFAALMGLSIAYIFVIFSMPSIGMTFFATAAGFCALSLWGYTTKRDLGPIGSFLMVGVWGLIAAILINAFFVKSAGFDLAISAIGVLIFAGLTAFDTQRVKEWYLAGDGAAVVARKSILGALQLYLDFLNMFLFLLRFMGNRR